MPIEKYVPVPRSLVTAIGSTDSWSDAVVANGFVWVTGQIGWDKATGRIVEGIEAQTELALQNLKEVLERAGSDLSKVVRTTLYITDQDHYLAYDEVYKRYFPQENPPARVTTVVAENIDHVLIDIEAVAVID